MTAYVQFAYAAGQSWRDPDLALVTDDNGFTYVFPPNGEDEDFVQREKYIKENVQGPKTAADWQDVATYNLSFTEFSAPIPVDSFSTGVKKAQEWLQGVSLPPKPKDTTAEQEQNS